MFLIFILFLGSANFYNKTANGITVYLNKQTGQTEIYIQKKKKKI